ncbi:MAG: FoF1 ATP synthase subunit A [Bacilli bacterium]|jgi:F-type H+-transporting ATPase subunit a
MNKVILLSAIGDRLKGAMLPEKVDFFGIKVGPSLFSAFFVTALIILVCLIIRIFFIRKFSDKPGRFQVALEGIVNFFEGITNDSIHKYKDFITCYVFTAAMYICLGTCLELWGLRPVLSDINACIGMALFTYGQLVIYSLLNKGIIKGAFNSLKEITVAVSFSFRLFGSILSGFLIMELVYSIIYISFVIPAFLHVVFTLFHAFIQAYVFAMLSSLFLGEAIGEKEIMVESPKKMNLSNI